MQVIFAKLPAPKKHHAGNRNNEYIIKGKLQEKEEQIQTLIEKQERFEIVIQSLIDSGLLKPVDMKNNNNIIS